MTKKERGKIYLKVSQLDEYPTGLCYALLDEAFGDYKYISTDAVEFFPEFASFKPLFTKYGCYWWKPSDVKSRKECMLRCYEMTKQTKS